MDGSISKNNLLLGTDHLKLRGGGEGGEGVEHIGEKSCTIEPGERITICTPKSYKDILWQNGEKGAFVED